MSRETDDAEARSRLIEWVEDHPNQKAGYVVRSLEMRGWSGSTLRVVLWELINRSEVTLTPDRRLVMPGGEP